MNPERIILRAQGSAQEPYEIIFHWSDSRLSIACSCPAGTMGTSCKHRIALLTGDVSHAEETTPGGLTLALQWAEQDGRAMAALLALDELERDLATVKRRVAAAKNALSIAMKAL